MKKYLLCIVIVAIAFTGCKKDEKKIVKLWKLVMYSYDGVPQTLNSDYSLDIKEDGTYSTGPYLFAKSPGTWALSDDDGTLILFPNSGSTVSMKILNLNNKELWLQESYSNHVEEYHWEPK